MQRSLCPQALSTRSPAPLAELPSFFTPCRPGSVSSFFFLEALPLPWQVCATGRNLVLPRASGLPLVRGWVAVLPGHHFHLPTIFSKSERREHRGRGCSCRPGAAPRPVELGLGDGRGPPFPAVPDNTSLIARAVLWPVSAADPLLWIRCCQSRVPNPLSGVPALRIGGSPMSDSRSTLSLSHSHRPQIQPHVCRLPLLCLVKAGWPLLPGPSPLSPPPGRLP